MRGSLRFSIQWNDGQDISIHASTWEAASYTNQKRWFQDFNSRLYMRGSYLQFWSISAFYYFNSRLYMRGSFLALLQYLQIVNFNSRLYMRGSREKSKTTTYRFLFQFTPLHERQQNDWVDKEYNSLFQFTPLHERQRKRLDLQHIISNISIHASTWEAACLI